MVGYALGLGATAEMLQAVSLAVSETVTNVVLHAYPEGAPGQLRVRGCRRGVEIELAVEDDGSWRDRSEHHDGRGLAIIEAVSTGVDVQRGSSGSRVVFRRALPTTGSSAVPGSS